MNNGPAHAAVHEKLRSIKGTLIPEWNAGVYRLRQSPGKCFAALLCHVNLRAMSCGAEPFLSSRHSLPKLRNQDRVSLEFLLFEGSRRQKIRGNAFGLRKNLFAFKKVFLCEFSALSGGGNFAPDYF